MKNNLLIYFRNLRKERVRILNLISMTVTFAFALLILFFVEDELSYDRWNKNAPNIYRVGTFDKWPAKQFSYATSTAYCGPALLSEFPEIKSFVRFLKFRNPKVVIDNSEFIEEKFFFTDASFFEIFPYDLLEGSRENALSNPYSVVISKDLAKKYFNEEEALGRTILLSGENYTISGILDNSPNAHLEFTALLSFNNNELEKTISGSSSIVNFGEEKFYTYILTHNNTDMDKLRAKMPAFYEKFLELEKGYEYKLLFEALTDVHFSDRALENDLPTMNIKYIRIFEILLVIILIFSVINYINLLIGKSLKTGRFIGLNKMYGISKGQIFSYFISESLINVFIATLAGLLLLLLILPAYNEYFSKDLNLNIFANRNILVNILSLWILIGVVPGVLLAFIFIPIKPLFILKNQLVKRNRSLQKVFVFFELSLLVIVVFGIIIVNFQLFNLKNTKLGFNKENVVLLQIRDRELLKKASLFKDAIKKYPDVLAVGASDASVGSDYWVATFQAEIDDQMKAFDIKRLEVDENFTHVYELELVEGRFFNMDRKGDLSNCLLNEAAVQKLGLGTDVVNKRIRFGDNEEGLVIGVVKNFYFTSKHNEVEPLFICLSPDGLYTGIVSVKVAPLALRRTIGDLKHEWDSFSPDSEFSFTLVEDRVRAFYDNEERLSLVLKWGTLISFLIVSFGLICFVLFVIEQRTKEIAIRKVNGASSRGIVLRILLGEFIFPSIFALVLVMPLSHIVITGFLQATLMEVTIQWWIYVLTMLIILATLLLTTSYQLFRAGNRNPLQSLNTE